MVTLTCEICGESFEVKPYREKTARFCSRKCGGVWHAKTRLPSIVSKAMKGNTLRKGLHPTNSFKKGHRPWNKGKKGIHLSLQTEFKKGCKSAHKAPIGTIRTRFSHGVNRQYIKTDDKTWGIYAIYVWEKHFGKIKNGHVIHHKDKNTLNDDIKNLECLTRSEHIKKHLHNRH